MGNPETSLGESSEVLAKDESPTERATTIESPRSTIGISRPASISLALATRSASTVLSLAQMPAASIVSQQLIAQITQVDRTGGRLTEEHAQQINDNLQQLTGQGTAALPAIREFLQKNQDLVFDELNAGKVIGYPSLRAGLLDAIKQIGGLEAIALSREVLQTTADPSEIAILAQHLEEQAAGQFRGEALNAARETLAQIAAGKPNAKEAGPLFQLFQTYGDASVISDLEKALPQWNYYATMALAGLPGGEGIPTLIRQAQDSGVGGTARNTFAFQMLAQMSAQYPEAGAALIEQARANQIPDAAWRRIAEGLAGDQYQFVKEIVDMTSPLASAPALKTYHIESGNQNFYSTPVSANLPDDQLNQRRALIDQLLAMNSNPAAAQALQAARDKLPVNGTGR